MSGNELIVLTPLSGVFYPLKRVPDPVFSQKLAGDGISIANARSVTSLMALETARGDKGLPAAATAITLAARPENRAKIGGIMMSAALTAFLTGITEPIEFAFLFIAPVLNVIHALSAGVAYVVCILLGIKHGFTFSHGLIDSVVLFPKSHNALRLFALGPIWGALYFGVFSLLIRKLNLPTPGREAAEEAAVVHSAGGDEFALQIVRALGGRSNIVNLDACITRLRVKLKDSSYLLTGLNADQYADEMRGQLAR